MHIKSVTYDDFGYYVCKAINDAGEVITKAKLIESIKAYMIQEDIDEAQRKVEKRLSKKVKISRKASLTEETSLSSVNVEATVKSKKSKSSKKSSSESVNASATFKKKSEIKQLKTTDESSQLTISRKKQISDSDSDSSEIEEIVREYIEVSSRADFDNLKKNDELNEKMKPLKIEKFGNFSEAIIDFVTILYMLEKRIPITEINIMFNEDFFPNLKTPHFQNALVRLVEKKGQGQYVSEILAGKSVSEIEEKLARSLGWNAFSKMYESDSLSINDIISSMDINDFEIH